MKIIKNRHFIFNLFLFFFFAGVLLNFIILFFEIERDGGFKKFENEISKTYLATLSSKMVNDGSGGITLMFVGDVMLDRGVKWMVNKYGKSDWRYPFLNIADELWKADILFGNLEGPISDRGVKVGSIYSFRMEPQVIEGLKFAGFDILSLANNHIFDYTRKAMEDSFLRLKEGGIDFVGAGFNLKEACGYVIKELKGTKIAFLGFTQVGSSFWQAKENLSGVCWLNEKMVDYIKEAKEKADLVIVSIHFGEEYQEKANENQKYFARLAIDSGTDLVIGHHPHVIQELEKYKQGYIAYSLGNFVFDQNFSKETMRGLLLKVTIRDKKIKEIIPIEIEINDKFQPQVKK